MIKTVLIDARTPEHIVIAARSCTKYGVDCETEDSEAHEGLQEIQRKKFIVDHRRATITGFSWYVDGSDTAYYVNLAHADTENRLPDSFVYLWAEAIPKGAMGISHNAPYELISFKQRYNLWLPNLVCSMQLAVTHHGPDNYDLNKFYSEPLTNIRPIMEGIIEEFGTYDPERQGRNLTADQAFVYGQWAGKTTKSTHSYNGFVSKIAYSFGLKKLVKQIFNYDMTTFEQVVGEHDHMGQLTGEEVVVYGAEDAYWCVKVWNYLYDDLMKNNPKVLVTFFKQENPMIYIYAAAAVEGLKLNSDAIYERQALERENVAQLLREIKAALKEQLPFAPDPNPEMMRLQPYYVKAWQKKRKQIENWIHTPNSADTYEMVTQVSNPIGNSWAGVAGNGRLNINYWQTARVILYDLLGHKPVRIAGKVASDAEARGRVMLTYQLAEDEKKAHLLHLMNKMGSVEQAVKLYITPYTQLIDPETGRVYPTINSMLATRRMAMSNPNAMQLAKYGDSAYVRSYFEPDEADHVVLSADWSGVELVLIGEFSQDPEFMRCFAQIPYDDLHSGAAADCLAVKTLPGLTVEEFLQFKKNLNPNNRELRHLKTGQIQEPKDFFKYTRGTPVGKGANFNYWYSGALGTVAENLGWTTEEMWAGVERYRDRFWKDEEWRVDVCDTISKRGYIELPDGHRRERFEATSQWWVAMSRKFAQQGGGQAMEKFANLFMRGMQTRARNQAVNAMIQGSCAGMAKQAILAINEQADHRFFRFMMPIHDELVFSVHKDYVLEFIQIMKRCMNNLPMFVKTLPLHCTVAIGKTFGVKDQIELDEANPIEGVIPEKYAGQPLPENIVQDVINYIMESKT
jgi:DNA polymerase I-like protein with 3'-5' exonuclease and polymerase domains